MRIGLFIDTENYGGAESIVSSIAAHTVRTAHRPVIYHFGNPYLERTCVELGIESRKVPYRYAYKRTFRLPWFALRFSRMLERDGIDLLHSHLFGPIVAGGLTCRLAGIPHVGTLHDVYIVQERPIRAQLLRLVQRLGTELVCVSEKMAEYYADAARIPLSRLRVIRNGVDIDLYRGAGRQPRRHDAVRVIMVGRLDAIKRHDLLLRALARLVDVPRWRASIVGDGPERGRLEELARSLGLDARVDFLGQRDDVPALLAGADIFALVSDSEGMSLSLVEALASGLPVIATTVGNNSELVKDGWNGVLLAPGDGAALEKALRALVTDDELRAALGANSGRLSGDALDLRRALASYVSLYEETMPRSAGSDQNSV
jgi:glycosyltransferase involved in cell wall biosynthesis